MYRLEPSSDLGSDIRAVVAEIRAEDELVQQLEGQAKIVSRKRLAAAFARLERLQALLPDVPLPANLCSLAGS